MGSLVALALGIWKLVLIRSGWSVEVVRGEYFLFGAAVGAYNAAFALIALAVVWSGRRLSRLLALAALAVGLVCVLASSQSVVLEALFGTTGDVETTAWVTQAGFQAVYLLISLVAIRLCGYNQLVDKEVDHGRRIGSIIASRACYHLPSN